MKQYLFSLSLSLMAMSFAHPPAGHSYMSIKGVKQGQLRAASNGKGGREADGWFEIMSYSMGVASPTATSRTAANARSSHQTLSITKEIDASSALLSKALQTSEVLESVIIETLNDQKKVTLTITLKNALISELKVSAKTETVTFSFEGIMEKTGS
jgi:type VI secretion system Hcp family effector